MKTRNFLGAALLGWAYSFSAHAQVAVPGATTPGGVSAPIGSGAITPGVPGATSGVLPSGGVAPTGATVPIGTSGTPATGGTLYGSPLPTNTPAGTMSTTPGATTPSSTTRGTTGRRTSTTKARP